MQLRSLLRSNRFTGSSNARQLIPPFCKDEEKPLTLYAEEYGAEVQLQLKEPCGKVPLATLHLPPYVTERINFWNRWANYALERQYEYTPSLYGLEAYAASIAIDIARAVPTRPVDYCGLPVHDDYALCLHLHPSAIWAYDADFRNPDHACPLPPGVVPNKYLKQLLTSTKKAIQLTQNGYRGWGDFDYCCGYLHFDPAELPYCWMGYEDSFFLSPEYGFPQWLCDKAEEWERSLLDAYYENVRWKPDDILLHMQEDALAVDVARYLSPPHPVAMSKRFYADEDVLVLAHPR